MRTERTTSISGGKRRLRIVAAGLLLGLLAGQHAPANEARATSLVVLPIKLLDTSGEPTDQTSQHAGRLIGMADELATDLTRSGLYRATVIPADQLRNGCPSESVPCLLKFAQAQGADAIFIGVVHKSSTLIMQLWADSSTPGPAEISTPATSTSAGTLTRLGDVLRCSSPSRSATVCRSLVELGGSSALPSLFASTAANSSWLYGTTPAKPQAARPVTTTAKPISASRLPIRTQSRRLNGLLPSWRTPRSGYPIAGRLCSGSR